MLIGAAWLRLEARRRRGSLLVLTLLVALSAGTVCGALAGARRGASAVDRLLARTAPATALAHTNVDTAFDYRRLLALPEVAAVTTFPIYSGFAVDEAPTDPVGAFLPADAELMRTVERPVLLAGRLADPRRADEAVVTQGFVDRYHRGVGSVVTVRLFSSEQVNDGVSAVPVDPWPRPDGPSVRTRIVGVVRSPWLSDPIGDPGRLFPSAGLFAAYPESMNGDADNASELWALVRLVHGDADLATFRADLARLVGRADVEVRALSATTDHLREVTRFQSLWLVAFAAAAALAATVVVGQALARYRAVVRPDLMLLRSLGLTRQQELLCVTLGPALAAAAGTALGLAGAAVASRWMPFGAAATVEPSPGTDVDLLVLGLAGLGCLALVLLGAVALGSLGLGVSRTAPAGAPQTSAVAGAARRAGLPVPVTVGTRFALERGSGAVAVRAALGAATAGVVGVVIALVFSAAVADASARPARYGQVQQVETALGYGGQNLLGLSPRTLATLAGRDPRVAGTLDAPFAVATSRGVSVVAFGYGPEAGWPGLVLSRGAAPSSAAEVVLAPGTADRLGVGLGDVVDLAGQLQDDSRTRRSLRVVGVGFVPQTTYNDYDSGAWLSPDGYRQLFGGYFLNHDFYLAVRPGADALGVLTSFRDAMVAAGSKLTFVSLTDPPQRMLELRDLRVLPRALGLFVAVLAVAALGHALATTSRRRGGDLAVLRALGMTRPQCRATIGAQAGVLSGIGLLVGVPLGLALGRLLWRIVADSTPLAFQPPAWGGVALVMTLGTALTTAVLAAPAARRVTRLRIAELLRQE